MALDGGGVICAGLGAAETPLHAPYTPKQQFPATREPRLPRALQCIAAQDTHPLGGPRHLAHGDSSG